MIITAFTLVFLGLIFLAGAIEGHGNPKFQVQWTVHYLGITGSLAITVGLDLIFQYFGDL